ncbi:MAG: MarR family winged helix-turn-helix transcriptional regulator [Anaerotignum sp.]
MSFSEKVALKTEKMRNYTTEFTFVMNSLLKIHHVYITKNAQEVGVSTGQPPILMSLIEKNLQTQKELCSSIRIKPASMTDVLKRMERDELVERIRDENDKRNIRVSITDRGKDKFYEFIKKNSPVDDVAFRNFSEDEKTLFLAMLGRILENVDNDLCEMRD